MLDDMDSMDDELFSSALKSRSKQSSQRSKKSSFEDFDEDDPLGDLLSSDSESSPRRPLSQERRTSTTHISGSSTPKDKNPTKRSRVIADLFGLNTSDEPQPLQRANSSNIATENYQEDKKSDPSDWLGLKHDAEFDRADVKPRTMPEVQKKPSPAPRKSVPAEDEDLLSGLGIGNEAPKDVGSSSNPPTSTLDDLLEKSSKPVKRTSAGSEPKKTELILNSFINDYEKAPAPTVTTESVSQVGRAGYTPSASRELRRSGGRRAANLPDPLGLFSSQTESQSADPVPSAEPTKAVVAEPAIAASKIPTTTANEQLPTWLGGNAAPMSTSTSTSVTSVVAASAAPAQVNPSTKALIERGPSTSVVTRAPEQEVGLSLETADILAGLTNLEQQATAAVTEQQKSLLTALALKRQEDMLLTLQAQQAATLRQHEQQLGAIVQRQIQRQQQMIQQQQQIQAHVEALMAQPHMVAPLVLPQSFVKAADYQTDSEDLIKPSNQENLSKSNQYEEKIIELQGRIQYLEHEKGELEMKLDSERKRYEDRVNDLENSCRRHLLTNEEALQKQERRFVAEREELEREASARVQRLKDEHNEAYQQQAERLAALHSEWLADLQRLGEFHRHAVEMLRSEQTSAVEHWNEVQATEMAAMKDANSSARLLKTAVDHIESSATALQQMQHYLSQQEERKLHEREKLLHSQEDHLQGLRGALERQMSALEAERSRVAALSVDLERRMGRHEKQVEEERQRFAAREEEWTREKTSAIELLENDRQRLMNLQAEAEADVAHLATQKLELAADVARLETTIRLQGANASKKTQDVEQMEAEARATLESVQEASKELQHERERVAALQRRLFAEEQKLALREKEMDNRESQIKVECQKVAAARAEGMSALDKARQLEREHSDHASDFAQRLLHLKERENRLAKEKMTISLEWKRLNEMRDSIVCTQCGQAPSISLSSSKDVVDPLSIIMKLEAEQSFDFATLDTPNFQSTLLDTVSH